MSDHDDSPPIDDLLERAIQALNRGDVAAAHALADEVLASDADNLDATHLRETSTPPSGEIRRLTVVFCDVVGSTELSGRMEPEAYHSVLVDYQHLCREVLESRYQGSIISFRGDGVLAAFGFPEAHEDDVDRAVQGSLELLQEIAHLSGRLADDLGAPLEVRIAAHKGVVFLDRAQRDLYGFAVNVAARLEALADPGTLVVSDEVRSLLSDQYVLDSHPPRDLKGVAEPLASHTVRAHRPGRATAVPRARLVGREAELAVLLEGWRAAREGTRQSGTCVAIVGEAGIGKSRLIAELQMEAAVDGATILELGGSGLQTGAGLWPLRRLIEEQAGLAGAVDGPDRLGRLRRAATEAGLDDLGVALLATALGIDPAAGYDRVESDDRRLREQIEEAILRFVRAGFGDWGTVVVVEDLHWVDSATRDLVGRLIREDEPRLLVVLTSRDPAAVPRGDLATSLVLAPLDDRDRVDLVVALGGDDLDAKLVRQVVERSDGIPLFAGELVRAALLEGDGPEPTAAELTLAMAGMHEDARGVPEVLYEPLVARLNVAPHAMEVAAVAATLGRDVDRALLVRATPLPAAEVYDGIQALLDDRILEPHALRPDHLRFHHELVRAVVEDLQPPLRSQQLHRLVADAMLAAEADGQAVDWFVLGAHLQAAGDLRAGADAFLRAAAGARTRGALLEARAILTRAVEMVSDPGVDLPVQEVAVRLRRGYLAVSLEGNTSATAMADYDRCLELVASGDDPDGLVSTLTCIAAYCMAKGELDRCTALYMPMSEVTGPLRGIARYLAKTGEAMATFYRGDLRRALTLAEEAIVLGAAFDQVDAYEAWYFVPLDPRVCNHGTVAMARFLMGDVAGWREHVRASRSAAMALPFPTGAFTLAGFITFEVWMHVELGLDDGVLALLDEIDEISARHGFDQWAIVASTQREVSNALRAIDRGDDPAEILRLGHTLGGYLAMWKTMDQWVFLTYYTTCQGRLFAAAGERGLARATFEESLAIGERTGMRFYDAETLRHLAGVQDDPAERLAMLDAALELASEQKVAFIALRVAADLHRETGDDARLRDVVAQFPESASYAALDLARVLVSDRA